MRKKLYWKKAVAIGTAVLLGCGMTACGTNDADDSKKEEKQDAKKEEELLETMNQVTGLSSSDSDGVNKEETVYIMADQNGTPNEVIVSEWLKNPEKSKTIQDTTNLSDIENIKGDETYKTTADGIEWQANGSDIYYQGTSNKELPVEINVSYYLDDKKMEAKDMLGKSGKVKIRYDYVNKSVTKTKINGKETDIYAPFIMATGMLMPTDTFQNVKVSNGTVISEGNHIIAVGFGVPGLSDSMGLDEMTQLDVEVELPEYFEIAADVKDFNIGMSLTLCSNNLIDTDKLFDGASTDNLTTNVNKLIDGAQQLKDGSVKLADGTATLDSKLVEFSSGMKELAKGVKDYTDGVAKVKGGTKTLADGADTLDAGVIKAADGIASAKAGSKQLSDGAATLNTGAKDLSEGANHLNAGVKSVVDGAKDLDAGSATLVEGIVSADAGAHSVLSGIASLQEGVNKLVAGYEGEQGLVAGANTLAEKMGELNTAVKGMALPDMSSQSASLTDEQKAAIAQQIEAFLADGIGKQTLDATTTAFVTSVQNSMAQAGATLDEVTKATLSAVLDATFRVTFKNIYISAYASGVEKGMEQTLAEVATQLGAFGPQIDMLKSSVAQLSEGTTKLADGVGQVYQGTKSAGAGVDQLAAGAGQLSAGTEQLVTGSKTLKAGIGQLYNGSKELYSGSQTLYGGTQTLYGGSQSLYSGVQTLDAGLLQLMEGAGALKAGTARLRSGAHTLADGMNTLDASSSKLNGGATELETATTLVQDGVKELNAGAIQLKDGMVEFNREGIDKISGIVKEDLNHVKERLDAVTDSNDKYELYGGITEGNKGKEKFIIKIDGVEK